MGQVRLEFKNKPMPASVAVRRVDATHANALPAYVAAGMPQYPNSDAMAALRLASQITAEDLTPKPGQGGAWELVLDMPVYSVAALSFTCAD